jgi:hypothetical protein
MNHTGRGGRTGNERIQTERTATERTETVRTETVRTETERTETERTENERAHNEPPGKNRREMDRMKQERGRTPQGVADVSRTERELSQALEALAGGVPAAPDAYRTARGEWLRRERRRRLVLAVLIAVVFTLATLIGLWVLNQAPADPGVIFSGTGGTVAPGEVAVGPG